MSAETFTRPSSDDVEGVTSHIIASGKSALPASIREDHDLHDQVSRAMGVLGSLWADHAVAADGESAADETGSTSEPEHEPGAVLEPSFVEGVLSGATAHKRPSSPVRKAPTLRVLEKSKRSRPVKVLAALALVGLVAVTTDTLTHSSKPKHAGSTLAFGEASVLNEKGAQSQSAATLPPSLSGELAPAKVNTLLPYFDSFADESFKTAPGPQKDASRSAINFLKAYAAHPTAVPTDKFMAHHPSREAIIFDLWISAKDIFKGHDDYTIAQQKIIERAMANIYETSFTTAKKEQFIKVALKDLGLSQELNPVPKVVPTPSAQIVLPNAPPVPLPIPPMVVAPPDRPKPNVTRPPVVKQPVAAPVAPPRHVEAPPPPPLPANVIVPFYYRLGESTVSNAPASFRSASRAAANFLEAYANNPNMVIPPGFNVGRTRFEIIMFNKIVHDQRFAGQERLYTTAQQTNLAWAEAALYQVSKTLAQKQVMIQVALKALGLNADGTPIKPAGTP